MKIADQPHHRLTIKELTPEQLDAHLDSIRSRRLEPIRLYKEARELSDRVKAGKVKAKLDKKLAYFKKTCDAIDKSFEKLDKYSIEIKTLLFEINELGGIEHEEIGDSSSTS